MSRRLLFIVWCVLALQGCDRGPTLSALTDAVAQAEPGPAEPTASAEHAVTVHKNESCGCCELWVTHMQKAGFAVQVRNLDNLGPVKERVGIPPGMGACHTAEVGGYFIEGHVPANDVKRLLKERPDAKGLTVPGMPMGSPGMEVPSGKVEPYDVLLVSRDGKTSVYAHHGGP